jgi:hypothetical protein
MASTRLPFRPNSFCRFRVIVEQGDDIAYAGGEVKPEDFSDPEKFVRRFAEQQRWLRWRNYVTSRASGDSLLRLTRFRLLLIRRNLCSLLVCAD